LPRMSHTSLADCEQLEGSIKPTHSFKIIVGRQLNYRLELIYRISVITSKASPYFM
jgi:hypothetical protein